MAPHISTRSIRTFVLRQGRLTEGQQRNLDDHWQYYSVEVAERALDVPAIFGREAPLWVEVGFGNGEALARLASAHPQCDFLGVEVHLPGVGHALGEFAAAQLSNVRVVRHDALEVLADCLAPATVARMMLFFPDPWPKLRHHKRRMVNREFVQLVQRVLRPGGALHVATDWADYGLWVEDVMSKHSEMTAVTDPELLLRYTSIRPRTKFEQRGLRLGHSISELVYLQPAARDG